MKNDTMKKICWVTPDCFADCDIPYVPTLSREFFIHWIVLLPKNNSRYKTDDFIKYDSANLKVTVIEQKRRERNPLKFLDFLKINNIIQGDNPDLVYFNVIPVCPSILPLYWMLPKDKTIVTAHQGNVHAGMNRKIINKILRRLTYGTVKYVNMFSDYQVELFKRTFPSPEIFRIFLGLKDFGCPESKRNLYEKKVRFLSFGIINYAKNIDLLIEATNILYNKGIDNFIVSINGSCANWSFYQKKIKYPEAFELDIRMIANEEIADLYEKSHFFVQPYRVVSQSGPMKIAFNYNLPDIVSDQRGLLDEIRENVNGFSFKTGDAEDLARVMCNCINLYCDTEKYDLFLGKMKQYTRQKYSHESICSEYVRMFNKVIGYHKK